MKAASSKKTVGAIAGADQSERKKALETAIKQLERDFGAGTIMKLGENTHMEVQAVHTGSSHGLDRAGPRARHRRCAPRAYH